MQQVILGKNGELGIIQEIEFVEYAEQITQDRTWHVRLFSPNDQPRFFAIWSGDDEIPFIINEKHLDRCEILGEL